MSTNARNLALTKEQLRQRAVLYPPAFKESDLRDYLKSEYALYESTLKRIPEHAGPPLPSLREIRKQFGGGYARIQRIKREVEVELGLRAPDDIKPQRRRRSPEATGESWSVETDRRLARIEQALGDVRKEQKKSLQTASRRKSKGASPQRENLRFELERISRDLQVLAEAVNSQVRQTDSRSSSPLKREDVQDLSDLCSLLLGRVEGLSKQTRERHVSWEAAGEQVLQAAEQIRQATDDPPHSQNSKKIEQLEKKFDTSVAELEQNLSSLADNRKLRQSPARLDDPTLHVMAGIAHLRAEETEATVLERLRQMEQRMANRPVTLDDYSLAVIAGILILKDP